jgi:transcriptional regulator with XRE-family HTH domain
VSKDDDDLSRRIDRRVDGRVRIRREMPGRPKARLGAALGVSVQPVQTSERGANLLSAAKRVALAEALDAPLACFLDGLGVGGAPQSDLRPQGDERLQAFWSAADAGDFLRALSVLESPRLRRELLHLIQAMADEA